MPSEIQSTTESNYYDLLCGNNIVDFLFSSLDSPLEKQENAMTRKESFFEFVQFSAIFLARRKWLVYILIAALAFLLGHGISHAAPPEYTVLAQDELPQAFPVQAELYFQRGFLVIQSSHGKILQKEHLEDLDPLWTDFAINIGDRKVQINLMCECTENLTFHFQDPQDWDLYEISAHGE